jgi:sterol desaturase/sphingolipid hydroxylase (fatty acid hydroxylase superfamily)
MRELLATGLISLTLFGVIFGLLLPLSVIKGGLLSLFWFGWALSLLLPLVSVIRLIYCSVQSKREIVKPKTIHFVFITATLAIIMSVLPMISLLAITMLPLAVILANSALCWIVMRYGPTRDEKRIWIIAHAAAALTGIVMCVLSDSLQLFPAGLG